MNYFAVTPGGGIDADNLGPGFDPFQQMVQGPGGGRHSECLLDQVQGLAADYSARKVSSASSERQSSPSSHIFASFFFGGVEGRSDFGADPRLYPPPVLEDLGWGVAATSGSDFGIDFEAVGTGSFAFALSDQLSVFVSQLIELPSAPTGSDPGDEDGHRL